jgi:pimeloyl-ACP methyl ester carboxylesterase
MFGSSKYKLYRENGYEFLKITASDGGLGNLVLIHGMFGGLSNFDPLLDCIEGYTIYVPDIPLYDLKKSELTIPGLADWLLGFLESQKISNSVLLGNSMGGHVALEFAHNYPSQVKALVLTGSSGLLEYDFGSSFPKRKSREYLKERANMTFYDDLADDVIVDEILEVVNSRSKMLSLLKLTRSTHSHNMEDILAEIYQPTLLVWGKQDVVTPPKIALKFKSLLPNARLNWIDQCGHAPMMERPEQFSAMMKDFLLELEQQNRSKKKIL